MGLPILVFFIIGAGYLLYLIFRKKQYKWSLPLIVILCVYVTGSFIIACKTPWLCLSALPALAMTAGGGALFLLKNAARSKLLLIIFVLLFIFLIFAGFPFSYAGYHMETYQKGWSCSGLSRELAIYLNKNTQNTDRLMLTQFSYWGSPPCPMCPVFLYYFNGRPVYIIDGRDSAEEVMREIVNNKISWLVVIDSKDTNFNFHPLVNSLANSVLGKPAVVGCSYIWKTGPLWRGNSRLL